MKQQVITIGPNGQVSGLQVKPGKGLDLRKLGPAKITRVSEIAWNEEAQMWYVCVLLDPGKGALTYGRWHRAMGDELPDGCIDGLSDEDDLLLFADYPQAVDAEIAYLDALRKKGSYASV